jgi:hypothetical protein
MSDAPRIVAFPVDKMSEQTDKPQESPKAPEKKPSRWSRLRDKVGTALGEYLFGGNR